ncbi:ribosomal RNA small subunit methyltransferase E [Arthrobacter sp. Hiyo8]|nr:ribosomal RNA small subunit methyltransferase E [Arthrobacter sp. Hiyo8]
MSNPVFFTAAGSLDGLGPGDSFMLDGAEARHAVTVKRLEIGEAVDIADGAGKRLTGTVAESGQGTLTVVASAVQEEHQPAVRLVLVQALAKGDRDELAVETATELGIDAVVPWQAERSIVRWKGDRAAKAHAKWQSVATAAAKQARRAWIPRCVPPSTAPAWLRRCRRRSGDHPARGRETSATGGPGEVARRGFRRRCRAGREVLLIVGPEGGISPREVTKLSDVGAVTALLGHHVLRSSTAGPAAVVLASDILGRW